MRIRVAGKQYHRGYFDTIEEAVKARKEAEKNTIIPWLKNMKNLCSGRKRSSCCLFLFSRAHFSFFIFSLFSLLFSFVSACPIRQNPERREKGKMAVIGMIYSCPRFSREGNGILENRIYSHIVN
jgi:hypothetical protein